MSYYIGIKKSDVQNAKTIYEKAGYETQTLPYTKKGLTQSKLSKLRITNMGRSEFEKAINCRKLQNTNIKKYVETF